MKPLFLLALGLWLILGTGLPAGAQPTLPQGSADHPCDQPAAGAESGESEGHAVIATIKGVDRQRGLLELETQQGRVVMETPPAETQSLQEGDHLLVCVEGEALGDEERLAAPVR
jgi:hypothetical protein